MRLAGPPFRDMRALVISLAALAIGGCSWLYPTAVPIHTERYPRVEGQRADGLLVLLPGRGDSMGSFAEHGFVNDVRASGAPVDIVAVDAHLGYYIKNAIADRLWADVITPARQQGYRHIWVAGISMGGLGALALARDHGEALERLILIAPYVGPADLLGQIEAAGGPARWTATDPKDLYQRTWMWLKHRAEPGATGPTIQLGFGTSDKLVRGHRLLAQLLPPDAALEEPGAHDWVTWRKLWLRLWPPAAVR
jgi:pimeloyl-ACP methyl ester carboxylesterase